MDPTTEDIKNAYIEAKQNYAARLVDQDQTRSASQIASENFRRANAAVSQAKKDLEAATTAWAELMAQTPEDQIAPN